MELVGEKTPEQLERLRGLIQDKIVLTGYHNLTYPNGEKGKDEYAVPSDSNGMFGVEIHGHIIGNLIHREWLRRAPIADEGLRLWFAVFITSAVVMYTAKVMTVCIVLGLMVASCVATYILFAFYNYWVGGIGLYLLSSAVFLAISVVFRHRRVVAYREYLSQMLGTRWSD
jgi:CHASE2 domain-containing sensor protein